MKGFTLIETLIYLALLGMLMTGAITALYSIEESVDSERSAAVIENEGGFVLAKIDYLISHATSATVTGQGTVLRFYNDEKLLTLLQEDGTLNLQEGSAKLPLTSENVTAGSLSFVSVTDGGNVVGIDASFTIDGTPFETRAYFMP